MTDDFYTTRYREALEIAAYWHRDQCKKGTGSDFGVPYISHLMKVSALVWDDGGNETEAIAGLLHDAVEDGRASLGEVGERFGDDVSRIVFHCSDSTPVKGEEKAPWFERKAHHLATLDDAASTSPDVVLPTMRVMGADKLANVRSMLVDHRGGAPDLWDRFKGGLGGSVWYYSEMSALVSRSLPDSMLARELGLAVGALEVVMAEMADGFHGADSLIASELGDAAKSGDADATRHLAFELARAETSGINQAGGVPRQTSSAARSVMMRWFGRTGPDAPKL